MSKKTYMLNIAAFTLIELLVVIAIIGILVSILVPALAMAREHTRRAVSLSNTKQISIAFVMYTDEYDGHFPISVTERGANDLGRWGNVPDTAVARAPFSIRAQLDKYVPNLNMGENNVFKCPSSSDAWPDPGPGKWFTTDYGFHLNESNYSSGFGQSDWYKANLDYGYNERNTVSNLADSAAFIIMADAGRFDGTPSRGGLFPLQAIAPNDAGQARMLERHRGGANVGYADGHSEYSTFWKTWNKNQWKRHP